MKELEKQVMDFTKNENESLLFRAILYEIWYQYNLVKEDYTDFDKVNLTLEDLKDIADGVIGSYYLNEGLNELVQDRLFSYVPNN